MRFHISFRCWLLGHEDFVRCTHEPLVSRVHRVRARNEGVGHWHEQSERRPRERETDTCHGRLRSLREAGQEDRRVESCELVEGATMRASLRLLTLITCYPFSYVGKAPRRFIVRAERTTMAEPNFSIRRNPDRGRA